MSKLEMLTEAIYKIDGDWYHIGKHMQELLDAGLIQDLKNYCKGVSDVVFIKGCPKKIADSFKNINSILGVSNV